MVQFLKALFKPRYTKWELVSTEIVQEAVRVQVEDTRYSYGYGVTDPLDVKWVATGEYVDVKYEVYRKTDLKTGLPKYKKVRLP